MLHVEGVLAPNIRTHLMREDIKDPRKLAAKADEIWQSASEQSINAVSWASPPAPAPVLEDSALTALRQSQPPRPTPRPTPRAAPCPAPHSTHS